MDSRRISPRDLYRLRRTRLTALRLALRAQVAQHNLEELTLEMERRYELLGKSSSIDIHSGRITINQPNHPEPAYSGSKEEVHEPQ